MVTVMKSHIVYGLLTIWVGGASCAGLQELPDASGSFEAEEVVVSAEIPGKLIRFAVEEGQQLPRDSAVGQIDPLPVALQKAQVEASLSSLQDKTLDPAPQLQLLRDQLAVQQSQLATLKKEKLRIEQLLRADAATGKQWDDIVGQEELLEKQMQVTRQQLQVQQTAIATQNRSILSEQKPLAKRAEQLEDQLRRAVILNPITGTVILKYARTGEVVGAGKALYKVANLSTLILRAYITATQLSQLKLGQTLSVRVDAGASQYRNYTGTLTWISDHAEFTPKTIQTKEERANLVYAIKVLVPNDGFLKMGMYGEIILNDERR